MTTLALTKYQGHYISVYLWILLWKCLQSYSYKEEYTSAVIVRTARTQGGTDVMTEFNSNEDVLIVRTLTHLISLSVSLFRMSRDESAEYLAGLGTVGMEIFEQVPKLDAVVVPAAGQYGLLAGTAAAIKHLNTRILVIVSSYPEVQA